MIRSIFENFDLKIGLLHYISASVEISLFCVLFTFHSLISSIRMLNLFIYRRKMLT